MVKWGYRFLGVFLLLCLAVSIWIRFSFTDAGSAIYDYQYFGAPSFETSTLSAEQIVEESDLIVKVVFQDNRDATKFNLQSEVEVLEVYKGDSSLKGTSLLIVEEMSIFTEFSSINRGEHVYLPLQSGEEYILCLKAVPFHPERKLSERQQKMYYPHTKDALSAYRLSDQKQIELFSQDSVQTIHSLAGYDLPAADQSTLDMYYRYKDQIFQLLGL